MVSDFAKKQKRDPRRQLAITAGAILILLIVALLIVSNIKIYIKKQKYTAQIQELKAKIEELKEKKVTLQDGIDNANNEEYIEKVAREELDLQKPGENVVSFIQASDKPQTQENQNEVVKGIGDFWNWVVSWFK